MLAMAALLGRNVPAYAGWYQEGEDWAAEERARTDDERLRRWLETARACEAELTGEAADHIPDRRIIVSSREENEERLLTAAGQIHDAEDHIVYVIGRNLTPSGAILKEVYGPEITYANLVEEYFEAGKDLYCAARFAVARNFRAESCTHVWEETISEAAGCTVKGRSVYRCGRCGEEREVFTSAAGHLDENSDGTCDRCGADMEEAGSQEADPTHWNIGDVLEKEIDGERYRFRCIDQNYSDGTENHRQAALFLCDTVIPADFGADYSYVLTENGEFEYQFRPGPIGYFGVGNDYKYSGIHGWLHGSEADFYDAEDINIGTSYACTGSTEAGRYSQLKESELEPFYIGSQKLTARLFVLSVDEALKYKNWLWRFGDTDDENPQTQVGEFSKAYWLRTPAGNARDYDTGFVYVVDLVNGNIRPEAVRPEGAVGSHGDGDIADRQLEVTGTTGVRPAFVIAQER